MSFTLILGQAPKPITVNWGSGCFSSYEGICCCLKNKLHIFVLDELHKRVGLGDNGSNKENCAHLKIVIQTS